MCMYSPVLRDKSHKALSSNVYNRICLNQDETEKAPLGIKILQEGFLFSLGCLCLCPW